MSTDNTPVWTVKRVDPKAFGKRGPIFWATIDPNGNATDAYPTRGAARAALKAAGLKMAGEVPTPAPVLHYVADCTPTVATAACGASVNTLTDRYTSTTFTTTCAACRATWAPYGGAK